MTGHTKEPWQTDEAEHEMPYQNIKLKAGRRTIAAIGIDDAPVHDFNSEQQANARRIVECVNALAGMKNPAALPALIEAAVDAMMTFDHYVELHAAKGTAEGDLKAGRNRQRAEALRTALANLQGDAA